MVLASYENRSVLSDSGWRKSPILQSEAHHLFSCTDFIYIILTSMI